MLATAVARCIQKCWTPSLAEPRPRTLDSGVRWLILPHAPHREPHEPHSHGRRQRGDEAQPAEDIDRSEVEPVAGIPDQVANASKHLMQERPGVAEQDEQAV